jgi:hypothetical protein
MFKVVHFFHMATSKSQGAFKIVAASLLGEPPGGTLNAPKS